MLLITLVVAAQIAAVEPKLATPPPVEVVVFSDFQCPFCAQIAPAIRRLESETIDGTSIRVQFRNFPLFIHPDARLAHQAAMAAAAQGQFWPMHDLLFAHRDAVKRHDLIGYAKTLGLDIARFETDLDSDRIGQQIEADIAEGNRSGVDATPSYTINGRHFSGTRTFEQLKELIVKEQFRAVAMAEVTDDAVSKGPSTAPLTLDLYMDLQSPVSRSTLDVVEQVAARYPSIRIRFRNFPLAFHPQAPLAHEAAMAAARYGRFWEFARYALDHQRSLSEQELIRYAGTVGLDQAAFAESLRQRRYAARVEADVEAGLVRGLRGSPVIVIGDTRIDGVPSLQQLARLVELALAGKSTP